VLTDFGTAAKGFVNDADGKQKRKLRRKDCLWPVGTPDYIAPEVLEAHEDALVRAEEEEWDDLDQADEQDEKEEGYGLEVDWWSLGVMI
jgi:serine/threonine protein kinase